MINELHSAELIGTRILIIDEAGVPSLFEYPSGVTATPFPSTQFEIQANPNPAIALPEVNFGRTRGPTPLPFYRTHKRRRK